MKRTHVAICKLNFPLCVFLPFGEHLHFIFERAVQHNKNEKKNYFESCLESVKAMGKRRAESIWRLQRKDSDYINMKEVELAL